jgi:hypothetical protein
MNLCSLVVIVQLAHCIFITIVSSARFLLRKHERLGGEVSVSERSDASISGILFGCPTIPVSGWPRSKLKWQN